MNDITRASGAQELIVEQYDQNIALLGWIGTMFLSFLPTLLFYIIKPDNQFISEHAKEALNWSFTMLGFYFLASLLPFSSIGLLVFPLLFVINVVICIKGCVAATKGQHMRAFFAIRILK